LTNIHYLVSLFLIIFLIGQVGAEDCPPDTIPITPPQNVWTIPNWNDWEGIEVVTWNIEHFPQSGSTTIDGVAEIILDQLADIYALQEIDDTLAFKNQLMPLLPNYSYVIGSNGYLAYLAVIYRNEVLSVTGMTELWADTDYWDDFDQDYYNNAQYYFASRPPLRIDFEWQCGNAGFNFSVIDVHLKCCTTGDGLVRRRIAAQLLGTYLDQQMAAGDSNIIVLGDWNDDLVDTPPYDAFTVLLNNSNINFVTLPLAQDPSNYYDSYPSWPSFLDHILITAGLFDDNIAGEVTTFRLDDYITNYSSIISDHRPVGWRFPVAGSAEASPFNIVISEIMANPAAVLDSYGEWFELYNADSVQIEISAWTIADADADNHSIDPGIDFFALEPGEYLIFGLDGNSAVNGGVSVDYVYSAFYLANSEDEIILRDSQGRLVDEVRYTASFPLTSGASMYLADLNSNHNLAASWVLSTETFGAGDYGTPGWGPFNLTIQKNETVFTTGFQLGINYPNPFNPRTMLTYQLETATNLRLSIIDLRGREITNLENGWKDAGWHQIIWEAEDNPSGLYFVRLENGTSSVIKKICLIK